MRVHNRSSSGVGAATVAVCTAVVLLGAPRARWLIALAAMGLSVLGAAVAWRRAQSVPTGEAGPWRMFAVGGLVSALANSVWLSSDLPTYLDQAASPANLLELGIHACFIAGMYALVRLRAYGRQVELLVDGALAASVPATLAWEWVVQPAVERGLNPAAAVNTLLLLAAAAMMLWLTGILVVQGRSCASLWLIVAATTGFVVQGVLMVVALRGAPADAGGAGLAGAIGASTLVGGALAVGAALHPSAVALTRPLDPQGPSLTTRRMLVLGACLSSIPLGLVIGPWGPGDRYHYGLFTVLALALGGVRILDVLSQRDAAIGRHEEAQRTLAQQATTDRVTGLPNRPHLEAALESALADRAVDGGRCAVLFMDLDDFKLVNDSFGHEAGDRVLVAVAERLLAARQGDEVVARFGGDEFVVLVPRVDGAERAVDVGRRYVSATSAIETLAGIEVRVHASVGVALSSDAVTTSSSMIADADAAMYRAKRAAERVVLFNDDLRTAAIHRLQVEQGLRRAIEEGALSTAYQPVVDLDTGIVQSVEVLVRWDDPRLGPQDPVAFVGVAEGSGLIHPLGEFVLETACRQWREWADGGLVLPVNVNVSARELVRAGYVRDLLAIMRRVDMPPDQLTLELTERDAADAETLVEVLLTLRTAGVRIAVDDFGTGYFSLVQLRQIPIDVLKVDRAFVTDMMDDPAADAIVEACIRMAAGLGLHVVAEGVETAEQRRRLGEMGCRHAQGFAFGRPTSPAGIRRHAGVVARPADELLEPSP
ncbi:putative bifunctional diguanylate cyclase/phosphodiesterase [Euzebya sp.]|uniref:putative bifunctional diguanylate cyclase/phosphodiesterase n=1 Tax=Euzebya sp. TaxID=1971409 RepID=UPI0035135EBA